MPTSRSKLVYLTGPVSRAGGGLSDAVRNLSLEIARQDRYELTTLGLADSATCSDWPLWGRINIRAMQVRGPRAFGYAPEMTKALRGQDPDLLHVHGLWLYTSVAAIRWARRRKPYVVSPHGMLDPWALKNSQWKKRMSAALYEKQHLRSAACLHALNRAEAEAIRAYGLRNPICIIPNGVELPMETEVSYEKKDRYLLYLGRLHPKKGLPALIEAWSRIQKEAARTGWQLQVAGWDQNGHKSDLEALTERLGATSNVRFVGAKFGKAKIESFRGASAFILPSLSEGLPMSVLEAWAWRLPVVITANCNLPEGACAGAAIMTGTEVDSIADALRRLISLSSFELKSMGEKGRRLVEEQFQWPSVAERMTQVYDWLLGCGIRPACVMN